MAAQISAYIGDDSSLYHLAGDSIVVNVLMAIFKEMIGY